MHRHSTTPALFVRPGTLRAGVAISAVRRYESGNLRTIAYPDGRHASTTYNALHLPETITGPDGSVRRQRFDDRGNRTAMIAPDGTSTTFTYDASGALATATFPNGATETAPTTRRAWFPLARPRSPTPHRTRRT